MREILVCNGEIDSAGSCSGDYEGILLEEINYPQQVLTFDVLLPVWGAIFALFGTAYLGRFITSQIRGLK